MEYYLGVTDLRWYNYLRTKAPEDVNFWQPGGKTAVRALRLGGAFLFKLKSPYNAIGGVAFFAAQSQLPLTLAWDTFGSRNGFDTIDLFRVAIQKYRGSSERNPIIGCVALTNPIFFDQQDWVPIPTDWSNSIVQGKRYSTNTPVGSTLWQQVQMVIEKYSATSLTSNQYSFAVAEDEPQYGKYIMQKVSIGQGAFRLSIIDAYDKRCAITGGKTLPVLEAAHIKPFAEAGPNQIVNGLLLRSDMHKLFDDGYITVRPDLTLVL